MTKRIFISAIILLAFITAPVIAEEDSNEWDMLEFSIMIGSTTDGNINFTEKSDLLLDSSFLLGGKLAYYLSRNVAIEVSGYYRFDEARYIFDKDYGGGDITAFRKESFENWHFSAGALINFGDLVNVPYITFGIGTTTLNYHEEFLEIPSAKNKFTVFGAIGYKYFLNDNFGARAEFTFQNFNFTNPDGSEEMHLNVLLSAGLVIRFH